MRGFPEERIQAALKKAFLFGLRDRAQAAMLNLTNAATLDDLLSTIHRSHAGLAISSIIEPLMKRPKLVIPMWKFRQPPTGSLRSNTPTAILFLNHTDK